MTFFAAEFIQQEGARKVTITFQLGVCLCKVPQRTSMAKLYTPVILGKEWNGGGTAPIYMTLLTIKHAMCVCACGP